jgi:hypothetical protein
MVSLIVQIIALYYLIKGIYKSQRRWLSVGYAALGYGIYSVLALLSLVIFLGTSNITDDEIFNFMYKLGFIQFLPSIIGANIPPRRA